MADLSDDVLNKLERLAKRAVEVRDEWDDLADEIRDEARKSYDPVVMLALIAELKRRRAEGAESVPVDSDIVAKVNDILSERGFTGYRKEGA